MAKTVEQIATALSLSITTVRLVLNDKAKQYRISAKTQARIVEYVEQHGYTVNHTARSLKLNKTETLGLIIPRLTNPFFSTLAEKLEIRCLEAGYQLMICCTYDDNKRENRLVEALIQRNVDGLFIAPSSLQAQKHHLKFTDKPLVMLDRDFGNPQVSLVISDNAQGGEMLTSAMLQAQATPTLFMAGNIHQPAIKERIQGYRLAMKANGIAYNKEELLDDIHNRQEDGERIMQHYLTRNGKSPPAFIASSLPVLEGALNVLRSWCGRIPADINIGTFDEHAMLGFLPNNIWSVRQNEELLAEHAFTAMHTALNGDRQPVRHVVPMSLIYRQQTTDQAATI